MSNYTKLLNNLEKLKLTKTKENIDTYIELINKKEKDIVESLYELTNKELEFKDSKAITALVRMAGFPYQKTFEDFDFTFQPSINKEEILEFKNLRFLEKSENILLVGSPGVGKTHLATAIGTAAARNRYSTYFISCHGLFIIDEVGYLPIDIEGANLLFQLINKRYEKHSTIITTNKPFGEWGDLFGDNMIANAILDRLVHHSHIININGKSYRLKDKVNFKDQEAN